MAIGHITGKNEETEKFICLPEWAVSGPIEGISIHKEDFQPGKRVKIVQIGDGTTIEPEFGFVDAESPLLGVLPVPEAFKQQMMQVSPNHAVLAYIAAKINRVQSIYWRAKVVDNAGPRLLVNFIDGERAGQSDILLTIPVAAEEYEIDEIVLIDRISYDTPAVVGWWEWLDESIVITLLIIGNGSVSGGGKYSRGAEIAVVATPAINNFFVRWLENDEQVSASQAYEFIVERGRILTALFRDKFEQGSLLAVTARIGFNMARGACPLNVISWSSYGVQKTIPGWDGLPLFSTGVEFGRTSILNDRSYAMSSKGVGLTIDQLTSPFVRVRMRFLLIAWPRGKLWPDEFGVGEHGEIVAGEWTPWFTQDDVGTSLHIPYLCWTVSAHPNPLGTPSFYFSSQFEIDHR